MKTRRLLLSLLLVAALPLVGWTALAQYQFERGGTITIEGTSNVHGWSCEVGQFNGSFGAAEGLSAISAVTVNVPVSAIECKNGTMNSKTRETLKASQHPNIRYVLSSARVGQPDASGKVAIETTGQLTIAGSTKTVNMTVQAQPAAGGKYRLTGSVPVAMSEYGMRAPSAMMGAMKVGDRVTVRFDVTVAR